MTRHQHDESFKMLYGNLPVIRDHVAAFYPDLPPPHSIELLPSEWIQDYTPHELQKTVSDLAVLLQDEAGSPYACLVIEYQARKMIMTVRMAGYMDAAAHHLHHHGRQYRHGGSRTGGTRRHLCGQRTRGLPLVHLPAGGGDPVPAGGGTHD